MGFHICIGGYLFGIPVLQLWEAYLMIGLFLSSLLYTASRKACQCCYKQSLIITPEITHYLLYFGLNSKVPWKGTSYISSALFRITRCTACWEHVHIKGSVLDGCGSCSDAVSHILSERGCLVTTNDVNRCE